MGESLLRKQTSMKKMKDDIVNRQNSNKEKKANDDQINAAFNEPKVTQAIEQLENEL